MAKNIKMCRVQLYKVGETVKARYEGSIGSSDDSSLEKFSMNDFALGDSQSKADDLMAAAEAAMASDEGIE